MQLANFVAASFFDNLGVALASAGSAVVAQSFAAGSCPS